jgi:membrane-associated phospholipid phosphatase
VGTPDQRETQADLPRPVRWRSLWPAALAALIGLALIPVTRFTYEPIHHVVTLLEVRDVFSALNYLPGFTSIVVVVSVIWILDPPRRGLLIYLLVGLLVAGAINEPIKQILGRARPEYGLHMGSEERQRLERFRQEYPGLRINLEPSDQWLLLQRDRPYFETPFTSFPSGHANAAFVLCAFLVALYPRGRILWLLLAAGCALARVHLRHHYLEDILCGGALGWSVSQWVFAWRWPLRVAEFFGRQFARVMPSSHR